MGGTPEWRGTSSLWVLFEDPLGWAGESWDSVLGARWPVRSTRGSTEGCLPRPACPGPDFREKGI